MKNLELIHLFTDAAYQWICNDWAASLRYVILRDRNGRDWLTSLLIEISPVDNSQFRSFKISGKYIKAGQIEMRGVGWNGLHAIIDKALAGRLEIEESIYAIRSPDLVVESDMQQLDRFICPLHIKVSVEEPKTNEIFDFTSIDAELRKNELPFDGLSDLAGWLGVNDIARNAISESRIIVRPPVDLVWDQSSLHDGKIVLSFIAHQNLTVDRFTVAVRAFPGEGLASRKQVAERIVWEVEAGYKVGTVNFELPKVDTAMVMLMFGNATVRRQFFIDPEKASNARYLAVKTFDKNMEKLDANLFGDNSKRFEEAVDLLFFILGFSSVRLLGTDGPDIIVCSPSGQIVIIECTISISGFSEKLGKLVNRKSAMERALAQAGQATSTRALLITAQRTSDVASKHEELVRFGVRLVAREDLEKLVDRLSAAIDPEQILLDLAQPLA